MAKFNSIQKISVTYLHFLIIYMGLIFDFNYLKYIISILRKENCLNLKIKFTMISFQ